MVVSSLWSVLPVLLCFCVLLFIWCLLYHVDVANLLRFPGVSGVLNFVALQVFTALVLPGCTCTYFLVGSFGVVAVWVEGMLGHSFGETARETGQNHNSVVVRRNRLHW